MKTTLTLFLIIAVQIIYAQNENEAKKGEFIFSTALGFTSLETDMYKGSANTITYGAGYEFYLSESLSIVPEALLSRSKLNVSIEDIDFSEFTFISVPVNVRFSTNRERNVVLIGEAGIYGAYLAKVNSYSNGANLDEVETKNLGFNVGLNFNFGAKFKVADRLNLSLLLKSSGDLFQVYDNTEVEINDYYGLAIVLGFRN